MNNVESLCKEVSLRLSTHDLLMASGWTTMETIVTSFVDEKPNELLQLKKMQLEQEESIGLSVRKVDGLLHGEASEITAAVLSNNFDSKAHQNMVQRLRNAIEAIDLETDRLGNEYFSLQEQISGTKQRIVDRKRRQMEEARKKLEEKAERKKKEEEERRKKKEEEEERKKTEEGQRKKKEEERRKKKEEEEERKKTEEERRKRKEEDEQRKRKEEDEQRKRKEEEEEQRKEKEEEEGRKKKKEEEEHKKLKKEEEEERKKEEGENARKKKKKVTEKKLEEEKKLVEQDDKKRKAKEDEGVEKKKKKEEAMFNKTMDTDYDDDDSFWTDNNRLPLLQYEQDLMIDTFIDDVLFITAKGLGLERIFFNHLHLYSDSNFTVLVLNTTPDDEHFFLERLRILNPECPPKLITADVASRNREDIYRSGGVQFVTSRILMVDLLTNRVPFDCVIGILVFRAHEVLYGFQESFVLRLFREKKCHGFVKAFSDNCVQIAGDGLGQLQRLVSLLYVKRVVVLPRFYAAVKDCLDSDKPQQFVKTTIQLTNMQRKVQANLRDIIGTCVRELKQCTKGVDSETESEILAPSATLRPTKLELDLRRRDAVLTDRQQRLVADLRTLRALFHKVEDLDPSNALQFLKYIRSDKEVLENNSGWLFTQSAANLFANVDSLCSLRDEFGNRMISAPPKWSAFCSTLDEIVSNMSPKDSGSHVLVLVSNEHLSRQLIDLVKFGQHRYTWMLTRSLERLNRRESLVNAPPIRPLWNPVMVAHYDQQLFEKDRQDLRSLVKMAQKEVAREHRKRGKKLLLAKDDGTKQARLDQFGILPTAKGTEDNGNVTKAFAKRFPKNDVIQNVNDLTKTSLDKLPLAKEVTPSGMLPEDPFTSFYEQEMPQADDGNTEAAYVAGNMDERAPLLTYCSDEPSTSSATDFGEKALPLPVDEQNLLDSQLPIWHQHVRLRFSKREEERFLSSIQRESDTIETLIKEQAVLMVPREFDVSRDSVSQLRRLTMHRPDSRRRAVSTTQALTDEDFDDKLRPLVVVDMREFNSELPITLYRRGIDLHAATLEVGDYVLSPQICVERKSLDDLAQSLMNGRLFKQVEQMQRHYSKCILLIESNERVKNKRGICIGMFQGEHSKRARELRSLFALLIRNHPKLHIFWSASPAHSAEFFEELKMDQPNPHVDEALKKRRERGEPVTGGDKPVDGEEEEQHQDIDDQTVQELLIGDHNNPRGH
uniref:DNA repair endonuclease XPF n=1 Tax=Globodera rostochiensis TaxID=31243 RepID=A0A914HCD1_GLORO